MYAEEEAGPAITGYRLRANCQELKEQTLVPRFTQTPMFLGHFSRMQGFYICPGSGMRQSWRDANFQCAPLMLGLNWALSSLNP